jgi:hypothetical protein
VPPAELYVIQSYTREWQLKRSRQPAQSQVLRETINALFAPKLQGTIAGHDDHGSTLCIRQNATFSDDDEII